MRLYLCALVLLPAGLAGGASAQSFNIDCGPSGQDIPPQTYSGQAGQPGIWEGFSPASGPNPMNLRDTTGASTAVTLMTDAMLEYLQFEPPMSSVDYELMTDYVGFNTMSATWTFLGLAPGQYRIYTYSWATSGSSTQVFIAGASPATVVIADMSPTWVGHSQSVTFEVQTVTVTGNGQLDIITSRGRIPPAINGFQVVPIAPVISTSYCSSTANSTGVMAMARAVGSASIVANNIVLVADNCPSNTFGYFLYGPTQGNNNAFCGVNCLGSPTGRLPVAQIGTLGTSSFQIDNMNLPPGGPAFVAGTMNFQFFFRDQCALGNANFSDGIFVTLTP